MSTAFQPDLTLFLLRHGEAEGNRNRAFLGRRDDPLTHTGLSQVSELVQRFGDRSLDAIYSSPLQRAVATANMLATRKGLEVALVPELIEQDFGAWDGVPVSSIFDTNPAILHTWRTGGPDVRPESGESLQEVASRVSRAFQTLRNQHPRGACIALVGHGGAFQALVCTLLNVPLRPMWPFKLALASITEIHITADQPSLIRLSA